MKTTALVPWYGSKRTIADRIVTVLGKHRCYWEPFCGSMAVLFAKKPATMETVNDLHGDLVNLARHVQNPETWPELHARLALAFVGPAFYEDAARVVEESPFTPTLGRAVAYFVYCWQGRNGAAGSGGGKNFCVRFTSNGGSPGTRFKSTVDSIPAWAERLRGVVILNGDAFEILERVEDKEGTAIYCDPPYLAKKAKYDHDFAGEDHRRLADSLARFRRTKVVVSYYEHPRLAELYPGWQKHTVEVTKAIVQQNKRDEAGAEKALEVLLVNARTGGGLF